MIQPRQIWITVFFFVLLLTSAAAAQMRIDSMIVEVNGSRLALYGNFSQTQGAVLLNGTSLWIRIWTSNYISVALDTEKTGNLIVRNATGEELYESLTRLEIEISSRASGSLDGSGYMNDMSTSVSDTVCFIFDTKFRNRAEVYTQEAYGCRWDYSSSFVLYPSFGPSRYVSGSGVVLGVNGQRISKSGSEYSIVLPRRFLGKIHWYKTDGTFGDGSCEYSEIELTVHITDSGVSKVRSNTSCASTDPPEDHPVWNPDKSETNFKVLRLECPPATAGVSSRRGTVPVWHNGKRYHFPFGTNVRLFDLLGRSVQLSPEDAGSDCTVDLSRVPGGLYFLAAGQSLIRVNLQ